MNILKGKDRENAGYVEPEYKMERNDYKCENSASYYRIESKPISPSSIRKKKKIFIRKRKIQSDCIGFRLYR